MACRDPKPAADETPEGGKTVRQQSGVTTTRETVDVDGTPRRYLLSVPKTYDAKRSYPLIVALHGDGGNAEGFAHDSQLAASSGQDAILAFTDQSLDLFTPYDDNIDQKLVEAIIGEVKHEWTIDPSKIWGFGYSKGGYQLNEIACRKPGLLTAMAIHAGGAPQERDGDDNVDCPRAIGIATFVMHGADDDVGGGEFGARYWARRANCADTRSPSSPAICEQYNGCDARKPVVFCVVPHQSHALYSKAAADTWTWFKTL